jgi:hypothetical protein
VGHNVKTLRGQRITFTGIVRRNGVWVYQSRCAELARRAGVVDVDDYVWDGTTVLVKGDLRSKDVVDPVNEHSEDVLAVIRCRAQGLHIHVVTGDGFFSLLHGEPARCLELR